MTIEAHQGTKSRLLAAATALFAERGFHGTTARDIAQRAGVNLAAGNYHYGSKKALYLQVLRLQFAEIRAELARRGTVRAPEELTRLTRAEVIELIRRRSKAMLDLLIGPPPGVHGTLMQREMTDPSEALPVIVEEFIAPMVQETLEMLAALEPGLERGALERCVFSIVGQIVFYRFTMPAMLRMRQWSAYPVGLVPELADHVTEFSLGGLERLAAQSPLRGRKPTRSRRPNRRRINA